MYFTAENIIKNRITLGVTKNINPNRLDIAYGIDKNFFLGCAISITSILENNLNYEFNFHIFSNEINEDFKKKLKKLADKYNTTISIYIVNDNSLSHLPITKNWTIATYFRFIVADYFYNIIDRILYLDADIICKGSLQELITLKFENNIVYAVTDKDPIWWQKCAARLNEKKLLTGYFNAGFLLIDVKKWKHFNVNEKALELLSNRILSLNFTHLDQDVLNLILLEKIIYLDKKYNQQVNINYELKRNIPNYCYFLITDKTILIHYIGPTKPWHQWAKDYKCTLYFIETKSNSPWKSDPLLLANTTTQIRYCAKHMFHQKNLILSIFYYLKYYFKKLKISG